MPTGPAAAARALRPETRSGDTAPPTCAPPAEEAPFCSAKVVPRTTTTGTSANEATCSEKEPCGGTNDKAAS